MFEKSADDLAQEMEQLIDHEQACNRLITLIESDDELDHSNDMSTITAAVLGILSDTIARKNQELHNLIEAKNNQAMDRFIRRQIR